MRNGRLENPPCYYQMQDCAANYSGVCLALQSTRFKRGYCPFYKSGSGVQIIPDYFYIAFAGELYSVGEQSGKSGVLCALKMTCKKLNLMWIYRKCDDEEYLGKLVDGAKKAIENIEHGSNSYYRYLLRF